MCGIAGLIQTNGARVPDTHLALLETALAHRGPDGRRRWISTDGSCGFVHLRLAVIDPDQRSDQPMTSRDGALTILFNGEIFNFLELRDELTGQGVVFATESDTEVLIEAWRRWGPECLLRLNGMWAFVLRDNRSGDVHFARDRFGIKPLLYAQVDARFAFASEMRGLTALPFVKREVSPRVARRLLFDPMSIEASAETLHSAVKRLPAGHYGRLSQGVFETRRWWRTVDHLERAPQSLDAAAARFRELFLDSVRLRMRSDVRIGTCLSGGFDSTAVISAMAAVAADPSVDHRRSIEDWRHAFLASFPGHPHDETDMGRLAADHASAKLHILNLSEDDGVADVERVLADLDDVYIGLPAAPWKIYREVHRHGIRVTLDGHGADELIGAYFDPRHGFGFHLRNLVSRLGAGDLGRLVALRSSGDFFLRSNRLVPPAALPIPALEDALPREWSGFDRRLYRMFHATVLPTILRNFDRLSMAHGVEVRMPFMDWRLVTFSMSLPTAMKVGGGSSKRVARQALRGIMPETIRTSRRKVGFNSQMPDWMNGPLGRWALDQIEAPDDTGLGELVDLSALSKRIRRLNSARRWDWTRIARLWPYINLQWYLRRLGASVGAES